MPVIIMVDKECRDYEKHLQRTPKKKDAAMENRKPIVTEFKTTQDNEEETNNENFQDQVYKEISLINGQINRMNLGELKNACKELKLDCYGRKDPLKRRLKEHYKVEKLVQAGLLEAKANRNADYLLIIDFEATCEEKNPAGYPHEIIEFPAVLVSSEDEPRIVDVFHAYVRPVINPILSDFCKTLTGIEQNVVDEADVFCNVLQSFEAWMLGHGLGLTKSYLIVTDGPFDMGRFMYLQCQQSQIGFPDRLTYWANLRKVFVNFYKKSFYSHSSNCVNTAKIQLPGLQTMLSRLDMDFEGQPHCGLDDAKNIARIVVRLLKDKAVIRANEKIQRVASGIDDSNRCNGKLFSVVPVNRKEADHWFHGLKKQLNGNNNMVTEEE